MKNRKLHISQADFMLANRRASRQEEIEAHGRLITGRRMLHASRKTYNRKKLKPITVDE